MRRFGLLLGAALLCAGTLVVVARRRLTTVAVSGHSMEPSLHDGDWLIIVRDAVAAVGDVVIAADPRDNRRVIVKRVKSVGTDSQLMLVSDHPAHAGEEIGPVGPAAVLGKARLRYWPTDRIGRVQAL